MLNSNNNSYTMTVNFNMKYIQITNGLTVNIQILSLNVN